MAYVGIDLAWRDRARTGLAVVDQTGALLTCGSVRSGQEIDNWLKEHAPSPGVVAIDAPIIVTNSSGRRACEHLVSQAFGRFDAGCYPTHRGMPTMNPPRAEGLAARHGWSLSPANQARPLCFEVYPHAALVGIFRLGRILKYKRGKFESRQRAFTDLLALITTLDVLVLPQCARWLELVTQVNQAMRPVDLDQVEDEIDAIICAHVAWRWVHDPGSLQIYGDAHSGFIVAPPPPTHAPLPRVRNATAL
ncbi:MAG: DUF429 domain-containing protein [Actinomycetota bacterium]